MAARTGKIARLSKDTRDELNYRLQNGEPGQQLVKWLNELEETQEILELYFDGKPISEQNLSEWRQGGYQDWLKDQESRGRIERLTDRAEDLNQGADGEPISDRLSSVLAAELADAVLKLDEITDPNERWRRTKEILGHVSSLRNGDHRHQRLQMQQERWEHQKDREIDEEEKEAHAAKKQRLRSMLFDAQTEPAMADFFGGGEQGWKCVELLRCLKYDLPLPKRSGSKQSAAEKSPENQTSQSGLIQPNQT